MLRAGEFNRNEAVLPLENSRTMGMIASAITEQMDYSYNSGYGSADALMYQIEEASYRGYMRAIQDSGQIAALSDIAETNRETADKDFSVNLDGRELVSGITERVRRNGHDFQSGSRWAFG